MAKSTVTYDSIRNSIINRQFKPIYLFMGEESYFIDELTELLSSTVLNETEKDFNMLTFYGVDSDVNKIIAAARRFPMMAEHQLIIVKEAQNLDKFEVLDSYAKNPMRSTVLVINYKYGTVDRRKGVIKKIEKEGIVFESKKLYDNQIPGFITTYFKNKNIDIDAKSAQMLSDYVGNDISKLVPQFQKLEVSLPESQSLRRITSDLIEKNVGISKDFNSFELVNAIAIKDSVKANQIVNHLGKNPIMGTIAVLFNYFSNLLECFWLPKKDERNLMEALNIRSFTIIRDYSSGLRNYNARKVMDIITDLRTYDSRSKGVDNVSATQGDLLKELVYKIMH